MEQKISPALIIVPALGLGLIGALGVAYLARAAPPEPEPELEPVVTVALKHPPPEATVWQLGLCDWDITVAIHQIGGLAQMDVTEPITFEIPSGVQFPLRIVSLSVSKWIDFYGTPALQHLYEIQSFRPYLWDFEAGDWSNIPDPAYREAFIPSYGNYFFNVATAQFEPMGVAKTLEIQAVL